jgi:uncharacterized protein (DUF952 family)
VLIYKIFRAGEWAELQSQGKTQGAPIDVADGYVHFSSGETVKATAAKYFSGETGLVLLALESETLEPLKWEAARGALFPHLYRELRLSDVLWHTDLPLGPDGHIFPELS